MSYTRRKGEKRNFSFGFTGLNLVPLYSRVSCPALPPSRCILMQYIFSFLLRILFLLVLLVRPSARPVIFSSALQPPRPVPPSSSYSLSLGFSSFLLALDRRTKHQPIPDDRFKPPELEHSRQQRTKVLPMRLSLHFWRDEKTVLEDGKTKEENPYRFGFSTHPTWFVRTGPKKNERRRAPLAFINPRTERE